MHVISTIIVKEQNSLVLICSKMKDYHITLWPKWLLLLAFSGKTALLMKNSFFSQRWQPIVALVCRYFSCLKWLVYGWQLILIGIRNGKWDKWLTFSHFWTIVFQPFQNNDVGNESRHSCIFSCWKNIVWHAITRKHYFRNLTKCLKQAGKKLV